MSADLFGTASNQLQRPLADCVAQVGGDWAPLVRAWADSPAGRALIAHVDEIGRAHV